MFEQKILFYAFSPLLQKVVSPAASRPSDTYLSIFFPFLQCLVTISREACYCGSVYSTNYGCEPIERGAHIPVTREQCLRMLKTGKFENEFFNMTNIAINRDTLTTYISKGDRHKYGSCRGVNFIRASKQYEYSYERSTAVASVKTINLETATGLTDESPTDVKLPNNLQLPISKQEALSPLFGTIAWEQPILGCSEAELSNEHIELFEGIVQVYKRKEVKGNNKYAEALLSHYSDARAPDQISFGFSLRHAVELCGVNAFSTNQPDVSVIFLDTFDRRPGDTCLESVSGYTPMF